MEEFEAVLSLDVIFIENGDKSTFLDPIIIKFLLMIKTIFYRTNSMFMETHCSHICKTFTSLKSRLHHRI